MIDPTILAAVPAALKGDFAAGEVYRVGMLLFRKGAPGIVGHLVETKGLDLAAKTLLGASPVTALANMGMQTVGQAITMAQNEQIKAALSTLQSLQIGAMALSGVGIGISIISTALINAKVDRVSKQIDQIDSKLDRLAKSVEELRTESIQRDFVRLKTACEAADQAWKLPNPEPEWISAAQVLHELQNQFASRIHRLIIETEDVSLLEPFIDAFSMSAATRITCRVATGALEGAIENATSFSKELAGILQPLGAHQIVAAQLKSDGLLASDAAYVPALERLRPFAEAQAGLFREREAVAASAPITLRRVQELDIHGRDWLAAARSEKEEPVLLLKGKASA